MAHLRFGKSALLCLLAVSALAAPAVACPIGAGACNVTIGGGTVTCAKAVGAPKQFTGSYDGTTQILTLSWVADAGTSPDSYNVYRDDALLTSATSTTATDDLTTVTGVHYYYVKAVTSGVESPQSDTLWLAKQSASNPLPPVCRVIDVTIYTSPPGVYPGIGWDCLPA